MSFEPLIPASLWMALAVVGAALLVWYGWRRPSAISRGRWVLAVGLMTAALATVMGVLLNPTWVRELPPPPGKPLLSVLIDDSSSMTVPDGGGENGSGTRYEVATKLAEQLASDLERQFDVQIRTFSETTSSVGLKDLPSRAAKGQATDLAIAVGDVLAEDRPQGQAVVVLSDGIHNVSGGSQPVLDAARRAKSLAAPIYTRTISGGGASIDLAVDLKSPQDLAFVGQRVPVSVKVSGRGVKGARADVTLLYDGKEVGRESVALAGTDAASPEVRFWVKQEKMGLYPYEARIDPLPGEATQANNSSTYLLRVIDEPIKVLLVEGKPYWDSKFLMRTLSSVPAVELESVVRLTGGRLVHRTIGRKGKPAAKAAGNEAKAKVALVAADDAAATGVAAEDATVDAAKDAARAETWGIASDAAEVFGNAQKLKGFQVIVLGREAEWFLTDDALTTLQEWVAKEGGALVCSRGAPASQINQKLAKLLPVKWTPAREGRFRMRLTDDGRDMHWLGEDRQGDRRLAGLPTLASSAQVDRSKPLAVVLATGVAPGGQGGGSPAVVYQPYGAGRVIVIEGAGMWRWAFLPPQYQSQDEVYASLWHSLLRWVAGGAGLLPGQKLALRADKISFATDEPATATLLVRDESGNAKPVELIGPDLPRPKTFTPAALGDDPGSFRVNFGKLAPGRYQATVQGSESGDVVSRAVFDVRVIGAEQLDLQARPDLMKRVAEDAGGAVLGDDPAAQVGRLFKDHLARTRPPRHERSTAWDKPWVLLAVFGLWGLSWAVRRSGGLV